jgi:formylglycine-generating enzyme required for sulfatase activity
MVRFTRSLHTGELREMDDRTAQMTAPTDNSDFPTLSRPGGGDAGQRHGGPEDLLRLTQGDRIDDFEILEEIGRGGMGVVYRASEVSLKRVVALKVLNIDILRDPNACKRFRREAILAANLSHPNIVPVFHIEPGEVPRYFTMEFVKGVSLKEKVEAEGFLSPEQAVRIALQACQALQHAHGCGIVHRDIKPSNIILQNHVERVRITDFGIAQDTTGRLADSTETGQSTPGTPAFESPEQALGHKCGRRSDIFSLGMTLYYILTGRTAYQGDNRAQLALAFKEQKPSPPSRFNPEISPALDAIVLKMIQTNPQNRPGSVRDVYAALRRLSGESGGAGHQTHTESKAAKPRLMRVFRLVGVISLCLVFLAISAEIAFRTLNRETGPPPTVRETAAIQQRERMRPEPQSGLVQKTGVANSYLPGDDGDIHAGKDWPSPRFYDNRNGTVNDNYTGLTWLKNANPCGPKNWNDAIDYCNSLANGMAGLTDSSVAGDWRLPNDKEMCSLLDYGRSPLLPSEHPFTGAGDWYWLSNTMSGEMNALAFNLTDGTHITWGKTVNSWHVWPVRGQSTASCPAPVAKSGALKTYRRGDDGDHQVGVRWANPRFTDNPDGTVRDNNTGLVWLKNADAGGTATWKAAIEYANALCSGMAGLTDGSRPGDWRLPNIRELCSLLDYGHQPMLPSGHPFVFTGGPGTYWVSTTVPNNADNAYSVSLFDTNTYSSEKTKNNQVWAVRRPRVEQPVFFADSNLKAAVEAALGKTNPTSTDLLDLTSLKAEAKGITDLAGLEYATNVQHLELLQNQIRQASTLSGLVNLDYLDLRGNPIGDISALSTLVNLQYLTLYNCQISKISALTGLVNLTYLGLSDNSIGDISALSGLRKLRLLALDRSQVSNISALSELANLDVVYLQGNRITDLSPLSGKTKLLELYAGGNLISDLSALSGLTNLRRLELPANRIGNISPLAGLVNLQGLGLASNRIVDVSPLVRLVNLRTLMLNGNRISNISALAGLVSLTGELSLEGNQISDISALAGRTHLTHLWLNSNKISNISPLAGMTDLTILALVGNPLDRDAYDIHIPVIRHNNPGLTLHCDLANEGRTPTEKTFDLGSGVRMEFVLIPAGVFYMGSPVTEKDRIENEGPIHQVTISRPFYLGKCEVTQDQYSVVMGTNPSHFQGGTCPVEMVSWDDAMAFCEKMGAQCACSFRLPTEAEWEYACRAGTQTRLSHGDDPEYSQVGDYAWYADNSGATTHPVGQKKPNPYGVYDMQGNVCEWCSDRLKSVYHQPGPAVDPRGTPNGPSRVLRGGCWGGEGSNCRSAFRCVNAPGYRNDTVGFRVAFEPSSTTPVYFTGFYCRNASGGWGRALGNHYLVIEAEPAGNKVYSQTSLAGTTQVTPGLFDQFGLLAGPDSQRRDFYEIFANNTGRDLRVTRAVIFGTVMTASTAVLVPAVISTVGGGPAFLVPDTDPNHVLATATVPVSAPGSGTDGFTSTMGFTGRPITISFSPGVMIPAGGHLAFGFIVPLAQTVDATLFGTDTLPNELSSTTRAGVH